MANNPTPGKPGASSQPGPTPGKSSTPGQTAPSGDAARQGPAGLLTRAGMVWTAVAVALVMLVLLVVFMLQNQTPVTVNFLGLTGTLPLGLAIFIASVAGGVLVAVSGAARIIQLRTQRSRTAAAASKKN